MKDLNPGITKTVKWLNQIGFSTCDSGGGKTHDFTCDRSHPYIVLQVNKNWLIYETNLLVRELTKKGIEVTPQTAEWKTGDVHVQANYCPADGLAFVELIGVDDEMLYG